MEKEIRQLKVPPKVEERGSIVGYPIVYGKDSEDMGFIEQIAPGAAKKALGRSDIRALKNHDPNLIYGRQGVNLKITEDEHGLMYEATPIDTRNFKDIAEEVAAGLLTGQSFGFTVEKDEWHDLDSDHPRRTITEIKEIFDIGVVAYPAYPDTTVALRSLDAARAEVTPEQEAPTFTLAEIVTLTIDGEEFVFDGEDRFDLAAEKIEEVRASSIPTNPVDADTESDPTIIDDEVDDVTEKYLERVSKTLQRSKQ